MLEIIVEKKVIIYLMKQNSDVTICNSYKLESQNSVCCTV